MPHKYVLHVHAVNTLSNAVLSKSEEFIQRVLFDINWAWVPYAMPGIQLSRAVQSSIENKPDVLVLANHGLVVGSETAEQALKLLIKVEKKLKRTIRKTKKDNSNKLLSVINKSGYRLSKHKITHAIAMDRLALKIVKTGTLYPDHVVFLGPGPMKVISIAEFKNALKDPLYVNSNSVIIVRDFGVVISRDFSDNAESMLYCLASVLLRIQKGEELRYLTQEEELELMDWDAEKYRQSIQR